MSPSIRGLQSLRYRTEVAEFAALREQPEHRSNDDEKAAFRYALNFTKGLPHDPATGLLAEDSSYKLFVRAIDSGDEMDFRATPLGPPAAPDGGQTFLNGDGIDRVRAWESQGAGSAFDLQGPDAQAVTMPPAPSLGSAELLAEIAEVYAQALLRDVPFSRLQANGIADPQVELFLAVLRQLDWFGTTEIPGLTIEAQRRRRQDLTTGNLFRGISPGDNVGPYLSQFLLIGSGGLGGNTPVDQGQIQYGAQTISQQVLRAEPYAIGRDGKVVGDFLTEWNDWVDAQNGLDSRGTENYQNQSVFITTGRDLSTYVHHDALYQAYLNACLILLAGGRNAFPFDPGVPFQQNDEIDRQEGFAHFGPPHILSLVTEVATRALKAVRFQKFNVHRRLRPEAIGGRIEQAASLASDPALNGLGQRCQQLRQELENIGLLPEVRNHNGSDSVLLPMAFPEGSPMHPSYGAGHATVAGACVTVLKAFFDHSRPFAANGTDAGRAYVAADDGSALQEVDVVDLFGQPAALTVEGELNKLAANISIGRDWAGVHYFTDYWESLLLGERIALQILEEQRLAFQENFSMTVPLFGGGTVRI